MAAKPQSSGKATTQGQCSPAITGSGNTININVKSCGFTDDQLREWRSLLKSILAKQIDAKVLSAVVDEIRTGQIRIENGVIRIEERVTRINERLSEWHLTTEQSKTLARGVDHWHAKLVIESVLGNNDAAIFAIDLWNSLRGFSGQDEYTPTYSANIPPTLKGIVIVVGHGDFPAAIALQNAFKSIGVEAPGALEPGLSSDIIAIRVGGKP